MVAVIILNWNGSTLLREYLPSVVRNTPSDIARIFVADNGSTDDSLQLLRHDFHTVEVIELNDNYGYAGGYNRAIDAVAEMGGYDYVVLLNSDVLTPDGWLQPLYSYMRSHSEVGAVQPKMLQDRDDDLQEFEYAGAAGGFLDCHGFPYCRGRLFGTVEMDSGQYDDKDNSEPLSVFWASGACLMVRTELYRRVGGLDERFFAHMEEIDLCWRIHLAGSDIKTITAASVYHLGGGSLPQGNPRKTYLNFRNNLLMLHKNLPAHDAKRLLVVRRLYDTLAFFQAVATLRWGDARAILRAHRDFRTMREQYDGDKPTVNLLTSFHGAQANVVIQYYLLLRRRYSSLRF